MLLVARFLQVVLQLLLRLPAALAHGTYLLGRRRVVGMLMRAVIGRVWFLAHSGIVPPEVHIRKQRPPPGGGQFVPPDREMNIQGHGRCIEHLCH